MIYLIIAGHGIRRNGTFDPGATGYITKGEHRYMSENLFPAMRKLADDRFVFLDQYNVFDRGNIVALAKSYGKDTAVVELHFDASSSTDATGGHVIIHSAYSPDAMDLRIRDVIADMVGVRYSHKGIRGISGRNNLGNVNRTRFGGVNYRLVELGFGTNRKDANVIVDQVDEYARKLVGAIKGENITKPSTPVTQKPKPASPNTSKSISELAKEVISGTHGNGKAARMTSMEVSEAVYNQVQNEVNRQLLGSPAPKPVIKPKSTSVVGTTVRTNALFASGASTKNVRSSPISGYVADIDNSRRNPLRLQNVKGGHYIGFARIQDLTNSTPSVSTPKKAPAVNKISVGNTVRTNSLYGTSQSNHNVRSSPISGYIADIDNSRKNPIRLRNKKGGHYIGFTRAKDVN